VKNFVRYVKSVIAVFIIVALVTVTFGCSSNTAGNSGSSDKKVTLNVWINGKDSLIGPNEQEKPQDQWYISQAIKRFEDANPNVTVKLTIPPDALQAHTTFKVDALAGNAPDIANLWAGQFIFALKDCITPINKYIPEADKKDLNGWDTVTEGFKKDGDILGYPMPDNQVCFVLYNKKIIKECGLDFEKNPPRTKDDFLKAMETIKGKGYIPMAADEGAGYPYYWFYVGAYWWVQQTGLDAIMSSNNGTTNFADDKGLTGALDFYHEIYNKGYMNKDTATSSDSWNKFLQGTVAMYPGVSNVVNDAQSALGVENVGAMLPPNYNADSSIKDAVIGGPGQSLAVSKNCKNVDTAVKFLSFLNSKSEVLELNKFQTKVPVRKDVTADELGLKTDSVGAQLFSWSQNYVFWVDNSLYTNIVDDFNRYLPMVLVGKMSTSDFCKQVDKDKSQK